jgi:hypothetical protein
VSTTRQLVFGIDPQQGLAEFFTFAQVPDGNADSKAFTCCFIPPARGVGVVLMQESVFIGGNASVGMTLQAFQDALGQDGTENISARFVSARLDPEARMDANQVHRKVAKRYEKITWNGDNPALRGCEVLWTKDVDPINDRSTTWIPFSTTDPTRSRVQFESGLAEWIHIWVIDETTQVGVVALPPFMIEYYTTGPQQGFEG